MCWIGVLWIQEIRKKEKILITLAGNGEFFYDKTGLLCDKLYQYI